MCHVVMRPCRAGGGNVTALTSYAASHGRSMLVSGHADGTVRLHSISFQPSRSVCFAWHDESWQTAVTPECHVRIIVSLAGASPEHPLNVLSELGNARSKLLLCRRKPWWPQSQGPGS